MTFTKIIPKLYVGDQFDARLLRNKLNPEHRNVILDVRPFYGFSSEGYMLNPQKLWAASKVYADLMEEGYDIYVHCAMGIERSPFFAALIMKQRYPNIALWKCYENVCWARKQASHYTHWVDILSGDKTVIDSGYTYFGYDYFINPHTLPSLISWNTHSPIDGYDGENQAYTTRQHTGQTGAGRPRMDKPNPAEIQAKLGRGNHQLGKIKTKGGIW